MPEPGSGVSEHREDAIASDEVAALLSRITNRKGVILAETIPLFKAGVPIVAARAPGRLDVMGGIADYSGSLVLQWPIREATLVAAQAVPEPGLKIVSQTAGRAGESRCLTVDSLTTKSMLADGYESARLWFRRDPSNHWAAYVVGVVVVLARELGLNFDCGLRILVESHVPEGKGVSSSAALEVATMRAVTALVGLELEGPELARLCQLAENYVVGAPCGIMDQMTSAVGQAHALLALLCQPAQVQGFLPLPSSIGIWGIDSGIRHAVSGSYYTSVRTGTFMGYRIIADKAGLSTTRGCDDGVVQVEDPRWSGFLTNLTPLEFEREFSSVVPETMHGEEFLRRYDGTTDKVTRVDPMRTYAVRQPTAHPIYEHARVKRFVELLEGRLDEPDLQEMGEHMYASHASYSACGLGSEGTDLLVDIVRQVGPKGGLFGAKITGGGSGGTVAILGRSDAGQAVADIARRYHERTGREPYVFTGSSPGACHVAVQRTYR
jgi:L-arabinokinase